MAGNELINRQEAIDYFVEHTSFVDEDGKRVPSEKILRKMWTEVFSKIPTVEPLEKFEWCTDCKEYDQEKHCCPRWNKVIRQTVEEMQMMGKIAKVIEHDASITDTDGYKYYRTEYLCGNCKKKVIGGDDYCSHCGARLEWGYENL